uniref:TonB-dependent receptor n=1 Tax=Roseihalotalea indica TaxID=2867963 RepID=A0AA49GJV2_9BACT|nr:TonB-dependent receptor [Tunicatimonas sp. TK19036]
MRLPTSLFKCKQVFFALLIGSAVSYARPVFAQSAEDTVRVLEPVNITDTRLQTFTVGDKVESVTKRAIGTTDQSNLGRLLMNYSGINVRSYGVSGLSTASLRGSGSNHTPVFWEGINLQSSMNGSLDLTLVPVSFIDDVSLQYGSAGSLYGAGTMGGAIHLRSDAKVSPGLHGKLYQQVGSFGSRYSGIMAGYRYNKLSFRVRAFDSEADNDFPYFNVYRNREEKRQNAGIHQRGLLAESFLALAKHHQLALKYWAQDNQVEVPGVSAAGGEAKSTQDDLFHRAVLRWDFTRRNYQLQVKTAVLHHQLLYNDPVQSASSNQSTSWISEVENTFYLNATQWIFLGLNHTREQAIVENYGSQQPQRSRTALFLSYRAAFLRKIETSWGIRQTLIDQEWAPVLPSLALSYSANEHWHLRSKVGRSYNIPTFNDLYWAGASTGNPNLKPERGWSYEFGLESEHAPTENWQLTSEITAFSNLMDDWVQWIPLSGSGWSPRNVQQVWARGIEANIESTHTFSNTLNARFWGQYSYTRSTKEEVAAGGNPSELHKQLIYIPYHQAKASANVNYQDINFGLSGIFIGQQFTTGSNSQVLPSYLTCDVSVGYRWKISPTHHLLINTTLNNLLDQQYEVRQGYPMPGRNYQINLVYQFN